MSYSYQVFPTAAGAELHRFVRSVHCTAVEPVLRFRSAALAESAGRMWRESRERP